MRVTTFRLSPVCIKLCGGIVRSGVPAMTLVWAKTTFSVMPPSLSSSFSPMQAMTPRPLSRAWAVFWPMSYHNKVYTGGIIVSFVYPTRAKKKKGCSSDHLALSITADNDNDKIIKTYLITLSEDVASLRVSQDHPCHTTVLDHRRAEDRWY